MNKRILLFALALSFLLTSVAFADDCIGVLDNIFKSTSISEINQNTSKYDQKEVIIEGTVLRVINLFDKVRFYEISDGPNDDDKIHVITNKPLPAEDEVITIKGKVNQELKIGDFEFVVIKEQCRKEKKK